MRQPGARRAVTKSTVGARGIRVIPSGTMSPEPPLDATGIARRHFSPARKGYDPAEVRGYLHELSDLVARLQRAEAHQLERAERAEARAELAEQLDQHRLIELLGEETARVLDAARQAASDIRTKAQEGAARLVGDAQEEAHKLVEQAEHDGALRKVQILAEADAIRRDAGSALERGRAEGQALVDEMRRQAESERERMLAEGEQARADAEVEAERVRAAARDQARELVGEAEAVRERMLGDLARRRRSAREQLERLNAARERLLAAYEVVRRTVDEATTELTVALPEAKAASELALRRVTDEPEPTADELEAELAVARMSGLVDDDAGERDEADVARLDALIDGGLEADELHLGDVSEGRAVGPADRPSSGGAPGGRGTATGTGTGDRWRRFRRRLSEGQGDDARQADQPSAPVGETAGPAAGPTTDVLGVDAADATEGDASASAFESDEADALGLDTDDRDDRDDTAAVDSGTPAVTGSDDVARRKAGNEDVAGGDAGQAGDEHADVAQLFARLKAGRSDTGTRPDARGGGSSGETTAGGVAVAVADSAGGAGSHLAVVPPLASPDDAGSDATERSADRVAEADDDALDSEAYLHRRAPDPDAEVLAARDETLEPVERDLGRRLKRVLADEQNEVFDLLRRDKPVSVDDVVPGPTEHAHRYASAALADLGTAATHGAASVDGVVAGSCAALADELGQSLVEPMRERMTRSFDECDGDLEEVTERLRSLYREWKGQRIGEAVRHYTAAAYAWGLYEAAPAGAPLRWLVDRTGESCPDADDNALAGEVSKGEPFPTGVRCSPAHPGCRCLVVPAGSARADTGDDE
jgi:cell division septum initiation protein DivIVA